MDIKIKGGQVISGSVKISGYKNSAVAIIPATILLDRPVTLKNVPDISDAKRMIEVLEKLGSRINWEKNKEELTIDNSKLRFSELNHEDLGNMKGISLLWGPMLARFGKVTFEGLPGGCTLGFRTLRPHYLAFSDLGVRVAEDRNSARMDAGKARGAEILLTEMSPTATENAIMLAVGLRGVTRIVGAASEPQVQDLCSFLVKCGVKMRGVGSSVLEIEGGCALTPSDHTIMSDEHEATTFLAMGALTGGRVEVTNFNASTFKPIARTFNNFGIEIIFKKDSLIVEKKQKINLNYEDERGYLLVKPRPWPGLLVDNLPIFIPLALSAQSGQVMFHNWMYDGALYWVGELQKFGANIIMADPHRVIVTAGSKLEGAIIEAPYIIRAVIAMVMTAMISEGESTILNADVLYRGHPHFSDNLQKLGAKIEEVK